MDIGDQELQKELKAVRWGGADRRPTAVGGWPAANSRHRRSH